MILKVIKWVLALICVLSLAVAVSAAGQGTDGTELQVLQPQNLEIHLGESWAGEEFQLKTDIGVYPGVITVGEDGVLRLEIGGSEIYILSCVNSGAEIPTPGETAVPSEGTDSVDEPSEGTALAETIGEEVAPTETLPEKTEEGTVAGIPVKHIALFGCGLVLAIGALVGIGFYQKRSSNSDEDTDI